MPIAIEKLLSEIEELPNSSKEFLAEKIIEIIDRDKDINIEKEQLLEVKRRRAEILSGNVELIDGEIALQQVRSILNDN